MADSLYTVSKVIPDFHKEGGNVMELLQSLKSTVREAKAENPNLLGCHLQDVGFIQQENGLEIKLYFAQEGLNV